MADMEIKDKDASEKHWGRWYLSKSKPLSLNIYPDNPYTPYDIGLIRINSPAKVLHWINHFIESKNWITIDDIRDFMKACYYLQSKGITHPGDDLADTHWGY